MGNLMTKEEKGFVSVLATIVIWLLVGLSFKVMLDSGMVESSINKILSSYFLSTMVIEAILATLIMGLGLTSYITVKQTNAMKKAEAFMKDQTEDNNKEYIVE